MKMNILQLYTTWVDLLNMKWFWARKQLQNKKIHVQNEDGSYQWGGGRKWCLGNLLLWAAGNIYLMIHDVVILMCSLVRFLMTCWPVRLRYVQFLCAQCQQKSLNNNFWIPLVSVWRKSTHVQSHSDLHLSHSPFNSHGTPVTWRVHQEAED